MAAFEDNMVDVQQALTKRAKTVKIGIFIGILSEIYSVHVPYKKYIYAKKRCILFCCFISLFFALFEHCSLRGLSMIRGRFEKAMFLVPLFQLLLISQYRGFVTSKITIRSGIISTLEWCF
mgnify:CR=1 FL=1